jgi:hypothetical protein
LAANLQRNLDDLIHWRDHKSRFQDAVRAFIFRAKEIALLVYTEEIDDPLGTLAKPHMTFYIFSGPTGNPFDGVTGPSNIPECLGEFGGNRFYRER